MWQIIRTIGSTHGRHMRPRRVCFRSFSITVDGRMSVVAKQKDSPDYMDFYRNSTTFGAMAPFSQQKIDNLASNSYANFEFPVNNQAVDYWTALYHDGAKKGLISIEDEVGPWSVAHLASQPANSGASTINPNEANKFPSQGVAI